MAEIKFSGPLQRSNCKHPKKNRYISTLKINAEWSLVCLWSQYDPFKPDCLEFCRNSTFKEILVSGTFELKHNNNCVRNRKFVQLLEAGFAATTLIELEYNDSFYYGSHSYSISGTLKIPAYTVEKERTKGIQFESLMNLSNDFACLLDRNATYFSDVNVNCGEVSFAAHKNILSARSPVFATMFTTKMKENRDNQVNITDLNPSVFKTMLAYMYSGKTGELSAQSAGELLFAADKYQLQDLKRVCSDYLKSCTSAANVIQILILGYLHDEDLKVFALDFICNCSEEFEVLEKTVEWKNLREKLPSLAMDVLTGLVTSKDQKLKRCQMTRMTPEVPSPLSTPTEGRFSKQQVRYPADLQWIGVRVRGTQPALEQRLYH